MIAANWLIFVAALLIGIIVAWWLFARGSKGAVRDRRPDVLDEGAAPATRNQALIDAPPAAFVLPPAGAGAMAGIGEIVAVAAQDEVEEAAARRAIDAELEARVTDAPAVVPPDDTPEAAPAPAAPPAAETATPEVSGEPDDLRRIKGVGPKLVTLLHSLGVTRYAQIAAWSEADLDDLDTRLGAFAGRPRRDKWVEQARLLAAGDTGAYEAEFGKL